MRCPCSDVHFCEWALIDSRGFYSQAHRCFCLRPDQIAKIAIAHTDGKLAIFFKPELSFFVCNLTVGHTTAIVIDSASRQGNFKKSVSQLFILIKTHRYSERHGDSQVAD